MSSRPELCLTKDAALLDALFAKQTHRPASAAVRVKIAALYRAYGTAYPFCSFYASEDGCACAALYEGALLFSDERNLGEIWSDTLCLLPVGSVLSDTELRLPSMRQTSGSVMAVSARRRQSGEETICRVNEIQSVYRVLSLVFPEDYQMGTPQETEVFMRWYAEMSQNIRHGAARLYAMADKSAAVVLLGGGNALLSQLGTVQQARKIGCGSRLLQMALDDLGGRRLFVFSKDKDTNRFYQKAGFLPVGQWYDYRWQG